MCFAATGRYDSNDELPLSLFCQCFQEPMVFRCKLENAQSPHKKLMFKSIQNMTFPEESLSDSTQPD
jgi:hypothetical protein